MRLLRTICWMCAFLGVLHVSIPARSQGGDTNTQTPSSVPAQPPASAASPLPDQPTLKPAELDALVAPVALYPDALLANVLMASTYPLEVVHAERWVSQNKNLKGDALKAATENQAWDASVKALVAAPEVLEMMSERLDWTQKLGDAMLAQQVVRRTLVRLGHRQLDPIGRDAIAAEQVAGQVPVPPQLVQALDAVRRAAAHRPGQPSPVPVQGQRQRTVEPARQVGSRGVRSVVVDAGERRLDSE